MATNTNTTTTQSQRPAVEGQLVHAEFISNDPKTLRTFLEKNFNWKFETQKTPGGGPDYHLFETPGGSRGGVTAPPPQQTVGSCCYIAVNDIRATTKKIEKGGAKILVPPTEIPNMGWFCQFQVKGGPIMACWQAPNTN